MSKVTFGTGPFNEGQVYLGSNGVNYVYESGCFNLSKPADIDTVDGYSEQGVSDGSQLDAEGNPIPAGNKITTFYDATGAVVNSRDDEKTQGRTTTPSADGLGQVITTSDNETTFVCGLQGKGVVYNPATGMNELVDQNGDAMGISWFSSAPTNLVKLQIVQNDGEVIDGNGASVPATGLGGTAILMKDLVAVECDPDGNVVVVAVFPVDTTIGAETPDGTPLPFNSATNNHVHTLCCSWSQKVDVDGNVTSPTGVVSPAIGTDGSSIAAGTLVGSSTDANGNYESSHCIIEDPVITSSCVGLGVQLETAKGTNRKFSLSKVATYLQVPIGDIYVDSSTPVGLIAGREAITEVTIPDCGSTVAIHLETGYTGESGSGFAFFREQVTFDGGATWEYPLVTGGVDQVPLLDSNLSENSFSFYTVSPVLQGGTAQIGVRILLDRNSIASGRIAMNRTDALIEVIEARCC